MHLLSEQDVMVITVVDGIITVSTVEIIVEEPTGTDEETTGEVEVTAEVLPSSVLRVVVVEVLKKSDDEVLIILEELLQ